MVRGRGGYCIGARIEMKTDQEAVAIIQAKDNENPTLVVATENQNK